MTIKEIFLIKKMNSHHKYFNYYTTNNLKIKNYNSNVYNLLQFKQFNNK